VPELVGAGYLPVTAETHVRFKRPLLPGDRVLAAAGLARVTATRVFFADTILRLPSEGGAPQVAAEADVMVAFTGPAGRPRALRPDWRAGFEERAAQYAATVAAAGGARPVLV
jgi:acyl-CoA thioesterase FadM